MDRDTGLVVVFFEHARDITAGNRFLELSSNDLVTIALNPALRAEFKRQLAGINDPELRDQIVEFVLDFAEAKDNDARGAERRVDLIDRAGMGSAASVTGAGIIATGAAMLTVKGAAIGSLIGPAGTLIGGLVGLAAAGLGRHSLKREGDQSKYLGQKLRRLVENA